jgi:hypothetical protein
MSPWELLKIISQAVLWTLLISIAGVAWIDYTVPGAWPDLIGPSDFGSE